MSFDVEIGHTSRRGPREVNEDFGGAMRGDERTRGLIAALADGVSTGGQGLEAAQTTVMGLLADFFAAPETWETTVVFDRLIAAQNAWLADHNRRRQARGASSGGTGLTTLTALAIRGQTWTLAHVGDTRAWLCRAQGAHGASAAADSNGGSGGIGTGGDETVELVQLTHDHAFEQIDQRSQLTRAIGLDDTVRVDYSQGEVQVGDRFLLTSDGVHGVLAPARIAALLRAGASAQAASVALVDAALAAGSRDNASALVVRVAGLEERELHDELADVRRLPAGGTLKVGDVIDGYTVTALVADSGVHRLLQARDGATRELVALKTLSPARASDPEERAMLAHEAWLGQRVAGEGFVRVHARRSDATALYVVFDWHGGRTLEQMLAGGTHTPVRPAVAEVVSAAVALTRALGRLHRLGVVHRDIKPANLHLGEDGRWRIIDLGSAVSGRESAAQRELHAGTPSYMNPEQWEGARADAASDLFALGATLYQWLTGRLPYGEIEPYQLARYRRDPAPASRLRPDVPIWLDHLLAKALARDARHRFETAEELLLALERGASRPVSIAGPTPLIHRDPAALVKIALAVSLLFNALLVLWLLFLPR
ncbi:MAG: bifunctional protein-serine/threonine kinase/phosphatase [Burkholderiales bacterium]|nr:bifunctional protein-serine/threonine kinase/phosphatase [Burkholderiales bacterium]